MMNLLLATLALASLARGLNHQSRDTLSAAASTACTRIQSTLGYPIVRFSGLQYTSDATGAWDLLNDVQRPTCIVYPTSSADVQVAMKAIYAAKAPYAVRSGGHSAMQGWNNVQDGVLILFSQMTDVSYNTTTDSITLQPGVRWGDAYTALEPQGVAPVGGRQSDVGTALLLGGGLSFLSPAYGYASDQYKELDVVLVDGTLVTATATNSYSDLFRALKGGGNRFGIVTRYEVYAVHTGTKSDKNWYGGSIIYPNTSAEAIVKATAHYVRNVTDPNAILLVSLVNVMALGIITPLILVNLFYKGTSLPTDIFGEFLSITAVTKTLSQQSYLDVTKTLPAGSDRGFTQLFGASAFDSTEKLYLDALQHWSDYSVSVRFNVAMTTLAFTPVLNPQIQAGKARNGNVIDPPLGGYAAVQLATQLIPGVSTVPSSVASARKLLFEQVPRSSGQPLFLNECDKDQNVFESYGDYALLKSTYAKYDPTRFNVQYSDGPVGL